MTITYQFLFTHHIIFKLGVEIRLLSSTFLLNHSSLQTILLSHQWLCQENII